MKFSRDGRLALIILFVLIVVTVAAVLQQGNHAEIPYLGNSSAPSGMLALKLWLQRLGYPALAEPPSVFKPSKDIKSILIVQPIVQITKREWASLDTWIDDGGTLVLAGDNYESALAFEHFDFALTFLNSQGKELWAASPLLNSPALTQKLTLTLDLALSSARTDYLVLLAANDRPVIVSMQQGQGTVILSSTPLVFSNLALEDDTVATAVLNLIALSGRKGTVWLDDWHHGMQSESIVGPEQWVRSTPTGHAILFTIGVTFLALLLQGRAFGRPIPLAHEIKRRGPLEHVTAIANLNRKAGHRAEVLQQYRQRLKRHLGHRYRLDPSLPDSEYVRSLAQYNPTIDTNALLDLLRRLSQKNPSEAEVVHLASDAAQWIKE